MKLMKNSIAYMLQQRQLSHQFLYLPGKNRVEILLKVKKFK